MRIKSPGARAPVATVTWAAARIRGATAAFLTAIMLAHAGSAAGAELPAEQGPYRISTGDKIQIIVFGQETLSGEFVVDAAGAVLLPLLGEVSVNRLTRQEVEQTVKSKLEDGFLPAPVVSVRISEYRPIYIYGDVRTPGSYPFRPGHIILNAIALAGGLGTLVDATRGTLRTEFLAADQRLRTLLVTHRKLLIRLARLEAQRDGRSDFQVPESAELKSDDQTTQLVADEREAISSQSKALEDELRLLRSQIPLMETSIKGVKEQSRYEQVQLELIQTHLEDYEKLLSSGLARRYTGIELRREEARNKSNIERLATEATRLEQGISDIRIKMQSAQSLYDRTILAQLQETRAALQDLSLTIPSSREIRDAYLQQAGTLLSSGPGARRYSYMVVRNVNGEMHTFSAGQTTLLAAGDIVEVKGEPAEQGPLAAFSSGSKLGTETPGSP